MNAMCHKYAQPLSNVYIYLYTAFNVLYICVHFACMQTPTIGYMAS